MTKIMSSPSKKICMVCGDKALGYNFNAITCESCKAFFRRNALLNKEFTCPFSKNCEITVVTRRFCQRCRLEKCFQIGMNKEHIMSEEEKIRKRRKIEQNRAKRKKDDKPEDESSASEREDSCNNNHAKRSYNCRSPYDYNHSSLSCESQAQEHYENGPQSVVPKKESHHFPTINGTPAELVDGIVAIPEMSGQVINYLMKTSKDAMNVMSKIINSPKDAMKLISHLINYPGDALKIISKIMNSPFDALTVFTKFMSSPTDALEIITKIVSSPGDVLQFLQQLMNSPEDAVQIMDTFMNSPAEALRIINRMVNNSTVVDSTTTEAPAEQRCATEDCGNSNTMINMMLNSAQSPLSSAGLSPEVVQPSTSSIEVKSEYINAFTGSNSHNSQNNLINPIHNGSSSTSTNVINSHSSHKSSPMNGIKNEPANVVGGESINLNSSQMKVPRDAMKNILEDVEDRPIHPNSFESVLCEAIKLEYETYNSLPQSCGDSRDLSEAEEVKLNELILASKALYHPVDDDLSSLINDDERIKDDASSQDPQLLKLINLTAVAIRRLIKMSKKINAFRNMCQEDQVALLKGGCTEMMIMRSVMSYDCDHATWKIPHSKEDMSNIRVDVLKLAKGNVYEEHERFIRTFEPKWRMDENIILIMCAIVLFTPSRPRVIHSDVIKLEQNSYYYLLRRYLESVYPGCEAKSTFIKLIQKINEVQRLNEVIIGVYLNVNPSQVEPLLREIFDLKNH